MLRPRRMSRVSVTGTKRVMSDVIEAVHDLNLVHLVDYDGSWEGFDPGDPMEPADETSEQLVTVRSIESILDLDDDVSQRTVSADEVETELEEIRTEVNELDDRRSTLRDRLREVDDRIDTAEPFVDLGIDLDLLSGYETLAVRVGHGDPDEVRAALESAEGVQSFEVFSGDETIAAVARADEEGLDDALVGASFTSVEIPDAEGSPGRYVADLEQERREIESELETVNSQLRDLRVRRADFIVAAEEYLSIEVQKAEAPLRFATTENAFLAEGWVPTDRYQDLVEGIQRVAGDHVEVEELERATYDRHGHAEHSEHVEEAVADGGTEVPMTERGPPVVQDNPSPSKPFELFVQLFNRPRYSELDPTVLVFLTFPTFFGFMIGDVGYGIVYTIVGYLLWSRFDNPAIQSLGGVGMWAGFFTIVFGILYGEFFGLHQLGEVVWGGHPPIEKGLDAIEFALLWLFVVMVVGLLHVGTGYVLGFINTAQHSIVDAVLENGSWFLLMFGVWIWILSRHMSASKPEFIYQILDRGEEAVFALGFSGFSETMGLAALALALIGFLLMVSDEWRHVGFVAIIVGPLEALQVLVNILSYARITAVLLAKAGMAFVVNLLFFGLYEEHGESHFMISESPAHVAEELGCASVATCEAITFPGLIHGGIAAVIGGIFVLVVGHAIVWTLGITSAGLQALRLEYVEFFQKFYEGGGDPYEPFGYERG